MVSTDNRRAINEGVKLLDEKAPGWFNQINLERLDVRCSRLCVLGQVFGSSIDGQLELFNTFVWHETLQACGFYASGHRIDTDNWDKLTADWKEVISAKRNGTYVSPQ